MNERVIIFANGEVADLAAVRAMLRPTDFLVAADGGIRYLASLGLTPRVLLGDMDSLEASMEASLAARGVQVIRHPAEKDETDLELAVRWAVEQGFQTIRIVGALGGRPDHALANFFLLASPELSGRDVSLDDGAMEVFLVTGRAEIHGTAGDLVSLLPIHGEAEGVLTVGLAYPLRRETLLPYRTRGISNLMLGESAEVSLTAGMMLCIHIRQAN